MCGWTRRATIEETGCAQRMDATKADDVSIGDKAWYWFLGGALYDTANPRDIPERTRFIQTLKLSRRPSFLERASTDGGAGAPANDRKGATERKCAPRGELRADAGQAPLDYARFLAVLLTGPASVTSAGGADKVLASIPRRIESRATRSAFALGILWRELGRIPAGRTALVQLLESGQSADAIARPWSCSRGPHRAVRNASSSRGCSGASSRRSRYSNQGEPVFFFRRAARAGRQRISRRRRAMPARC